MGNIIYHFLFDRFRIDIPRPPCPSLNDKFYYESSVAQELMTLIGMLYLFITFLFIWCLGFQRFIQEYIQKPPHRE
jgi:hypothetical protein